MLERLYRIREKNTGRCLGVWYSNLEEAIRNFPSRRGINIYDEWDTILLTDEYETVQVEVRVLSVSSGFPPHHPKEPEPIDSRGESERLFLKLFGGT